MKTIALLIAAVLTLSSCGTYRKAVEAVGQNPDLVEPAVSLAVNLVFSKVLDPNDLPKVAAQVNKVADKIINTKFETKPTQAEVEALVTDNLSGSFAGPLALAVGKYYVKYTANIEAQDVEKSVAILRSIAAGVKASAAKYL